MHTKQSKFRKRAKLTSKHKATRPITGTTLVELIAYLTVIAFVLGTFVGNLKGIFDAGSREMVHSGLMTIVQGANACLRFTGSLPATSANILSCSGGIVKNVNLDPFSNTGKPGEGQFTDAEGNLRNFYYSKCGTNSSHTPYYNSSTNTLHYGTYCLPQITVGARVNTSATWDASSPSDTNAVVTGYADTTSTTSSSSSSSSSSTSSSSSSST